MGSSATRIISSFNPLSSDEVEDKNISNKPSIYIPEDLLLEILSYIPARDLLRNCNLVCKNWKMLIDSHTLWKAKCNRDKKVIPPIKLNELPSQYYKQIYFYDPYGKNLVKNPSGNEGLSMWECIYNAGDGFCTENPPGGADPIPKEALSDSCFATSYGKCTKNQMIDLLQEGVHKEILDNASTKIHISEWFTARFDCGCKYELNVYLLDEDYEKVDEFQFEHVTEQWTGRAWTLVSHTFEDVQNVRYIHFEHSGQDTQFWAGHYGSKMTGATVKICFK